MSLLPFEDLPQIQPGESVSFFEDFWASYPRKVGRKTAEAKYAKALKRANPADIYAGLERYKRNKPAYCDWMHPTTFLNGDHWEDEYDAPAPKPSSYTHDQLQIIAAHVKRDWYKGEYDRDVLQQCVDAGLLTAERMEEIS